MTTFRRAVMALVALVLITPAAAPAAPRPPAAGCAGLQDRMRMALGGAAWAHVGELRAVGTVTTAGLHGSARLDADVVNGRWAQRYRVPVMGSLANVDDGTTTWAQDGSGGVHAYDASFARGIAVTDAYLARRGYAASGDRAAFACAGTRTEDGRSVVVVHVTPTGGRPAELAFDAQTALLASARVRLPYTVRITHYDDYRTVGELVLPFAIHTATENEPENGETITVARYDVLRAADARDFARPVPTDVAGMRGNAGTTTVPLALEGRQLLVWATLDGHAPMPFIFDTGGHSILTAEAAKRLGYHVVGAGVSGGAGSGTISEGYTTVRTLRIGDAELRDQPFFVIPYPYSFYERGRRTPLAGILGLEIFERFAARIDYASLRLTLTPLASFHYHGTTAPLHIVFEEDAPLVEAAADDKPGLFMIDTGNAGTLVLYGSYLRRNGFFARYPAGVAAIGSGTGGTNTGTMQTLRRFTIGGHVLRDQLTYFTSMKSGSFASTFDVGNAGYQVLSRFVPTFDYAHEALYLDQSPHARPIPVNRAGLRAFKEKPSAFGVVAVRPGSAAAAAGIRPGDAIVAVDGVPAPAVSGADLFDRTCGPAGTQLSLRVVRAGAERTVVLVLR
ncbi:MAG: aspartyl protease family protein [Candidatus Eremiobacteraeota bacterium]|nr:aspartyl protease family protein [Candidatus Eremiobacteraeota bacterium]